MTSCRAVFVIEAVVEDVAQVRQAEERLAVGGFQAGHAGQGHFQGNGDLAFHLLGGGAGPLGDDLDDRRRRVGVGLDVDVVEGVAAHAARARASRRRSGDC